MLDVAIVVRSYFKRSIGNGRKQGYDIGGQFGDKTATMSDGKRRILLTEPTSAELDDALAQVGFLI